MKCKWNADFEGVCTNGECPYSGDRCPTIEHPEVCKHEEEIRPLSAEELATVLGICAYSECERCPYTYIELDEPCYTYVKRQAADMLEKLAAEKDTKKPEWIRVKDMPPTCF